MIHIINFLDNLQKNNYKEWFDDNKAQYKEALEVFNNFVEKLITGIASFDPAVKHLTVKDCTYRIYRDIRFSNDKTPYKSHMGAFISPGGKNGGKSGYYFHIEGKESNYIGGHILSSGIYRPEPKIIKSIREEIMLNGKEFLNAIETAKGFTLERAGSLKKVPQGFPSDSEYSEYFKLKDFFLTKNIDDNFILDKDLVNKTVSEFKKTLLFNNLLNKAVDYTAND